MADLPEPMTPPDCDLRGYDFMPLYGNRLFNSHIYRKAIREPRAGLAAMKLWWVAWLQCPAASLPDDDDDLAMLADFGLDTKAWMKVRALALHGFVKCSDGRLYHPVLAEAAIEAFARRKKERERKAANRAKKAGLNGDGGDRHEDVPRDMTRTSAGQDAEVTVSSRLTGQDRTGQGQDRTVIEDEREAPFSSGHASPQAAPQKTRVLRKQLPKDWRPDQGEREYAAQQGLDPDAVAVDFREYWVGHGKPMADWHLTWQRWCRTARDRAGQRGLRIVPGSASESRPERRIREQREAMERMTYPERFRDQEPFIDHVPEQRRLVQ